ncbi:MAG: PepSY domain-containing protein [Clostridiales bacterium]|nr:PepSY domain-containing protein [Clostridiales bacterium]
MMKQNRWKKSIAALTMAGVLALGMAAGAAVARQKITAELRPDITVKVNGTVQDLDKDAISYNGSTYLPVRAIGEAVGMDVNWDGETQTVSLEGAGSGDDVDGYISLADAKTIALKDAGLSAGQVTFTQTRGDWDDGRKVYDIEFVSGSTKYEYEIAAATGTVLKREQESWSGGSSGSTAIGVEKAKTIALKDAGLSAGQVTFTKAQTGWDDGRMEYDVEFRSGGIEYEYEIDAYSGAILSRDVDRD